MSVFDIRQIISAIQKVQTPAHNSFISGCAILTPANASNHDRVQIIWTLHRYAPAGEIEGYCRRIHAQLEIDMDAHDMNQGERFARTIELIEFPDSPFSRQHIRVAVQEALTAARDPIYSGYESLCSSESTSALMERTQPILDETPAAFEAMVGDMEHLLNHSSGFLKLKHR